MCIQHGAPALASQLTQSFNIMIDKANKAIALEKAEEENKRKVDIVKAEEAAKVSQPAKKVRSHYER